MMSPDNRVDLVAELRALGEPLRDEPAANDLVDAVTSRVAASGTPPVRSPARTWRAPGLGWWRWVAAVVAGLLAVVLLVPPIRAAVIDWFSFAGVIVRESPGSAPSSAPEPPAIDGEMGLARAERLVGFEVLIPSALGKPDVVDVINEQRILSMAWDTPDGAVRLDEFDGSLEPAFMKKTFGDARVVDVGGSTALWLDGPHQVVVLGDDGKTYAAPPRLAGSTLIWQPGDTTLRLEGDLDLGRALEIARSTR